jgi:hypothetical protein
LRNKIPVASVLSFNDATVRKITAVDRLVNQMWKFQATTTAAVLKSEPTSTFIPSRNRLNRFRDLRVMNGGKF